MSVRDQLPRTQRPGVVIRRGEEMSPLLALHREMNRMFDDFFRGFDSAPFGMGDFGGRQVGWPHMEASATDKEMKVTAELPGMDEKDVGIELANGVLTIRGEKKSETDDKDRLFSERFYGRFERRIPVDDVEPDKVSATFKNGLLTVTLPKSARVPEHVKRIPISRT